MGVRISMADYNEDAMSSGGLYALLPIGRYPARLKMDAYKHGPSGQFATNGAGDKVYWETEGDKSPKWNLEWNILNGLHVGDAVKDSISFGKAKNRALCLLKRGGLVEDDFVGDVEPEDLDGTYWWITIDHQASNKESRREFKANGCDCKTCQETEGKKLFVNSRVTWAGFELMDPKDAAIYTPKAGVTVEDIDKANCLPCASGEHFHQLDKGCPCQHIDHPRF